VLCNIAIRFVMLIGLARDCMEAEYYGFCYLVPFHFFKLLTEHKRDD